MEDLEYACLLIVTAVGETIRDLGMVTEGALYAGILHTCPWLSPLSFNLMMISLEEGGMIKRSNRIITWVHQDADKIAQN